MRRLPVLVLALSLSLGFVLSACGKKTPVAAPETLTSDPVAQEGFRLMKQEDCTSCHTYDGTRASGPTLKGLAGSRVTLANGQVALVDDGYLYRSLSDPDVEIRKGYDAGVMTAAMDTRKKLTAEQINAMVAAMKVLR